MEIDDRLLKMHEDDVVEAGADTPRDRASQQPIEPIATESSLVKKESSSVPGSS